MVKKVSIIPPLLITNKLISDFKVKANYFNDFLASQCTPLNSKIPETPQVANTKLSSVKFESEEISNIIRSLDVIKAHGHNNIFIRMSKICNCAIVGHLQSFVTFVLIKVCCLTSGKIKYMSYS